MVLFRYGVTLTPNLLEVHIMTTLNTLISTLLKTDDQQQLTVNQIAAEAALITFDEYRAIVVAAIAKRYTVKPHESKQGGKLTFAKDTAPEQKMSRLLKLHPDRAQGRAPTTAKKVAAPKALVSSVTKEVIAAGLTKAEFDAFIVALKASVTFA